MAAVKSGPWPAGMNNRAADHALPVSKYGRTVAVRNAVNVDIDAEGQLHRREGFVKVRSGVGARGGYSCPLGAYFVQGTKLFRLNADDSATELCDGILGDEITYEYFNGEVYFSDALVTKRITAAGAEEWGQDVPASPQLYGVVGALPPGTYLAAVTTVDAVGRESGASEVVSLDLNISSGIRFTGFPSGKTVRVYLSAVNSTALFLAAETSASSCDVLVDSYGAGAMLDKQFMSKPPAGRIIRAHKGRLYIADAYGAVWYTEPFTTDLVRLGSGFFQFPAPVTVMEPVAGGIWIVSDKTEFYAGTSPGDFRPVTRLGYGAVYGTGQRVERTEDAVWYSTQGVVMGTKDGQAENLQEKNVAPDSGTVGAALLREQDGMRQLVVGVRDPNVSPLAATSFLEMEVIRKAAQ